MEACGMSGWGAPQVAVPLNDGTQLLIGPNGVQAGEQLYPLATIHDARLVSPRPETIALRLANEGLVELQPDQQGDAARALEAIYRLRPDLRPAGFEPVSSLPPTFPPP